MSQHVIVTVACNCYRFEEHMIIYIVKYSKNVDVLYPILKDSFISQEVKIIFDSIFTPVLTYGAKKLGGDFHR